MERNNITTGKEARKKMLRAIKICADAVGSTMGTGGNNGLIEAMASPGYLLTNDGATLLESMVFEDPHEKMGHSILMESVSRSNKGSGDGSSGATKLTDKILQLGDKRLDGGFLRRKIHVMDLKRELESCIPVIEQAIDEQRRPISVDDVWKVAAISAEDEEIGRKIGEIYKEIGKDGIIHWDISKTGEDYHTIGQGLTVEGAGIASPYMFDMDKTTGSYAQHAKMVNPSIIVSREKITTGAAFESIFSTLNAKGKKEVVIFCEDFEVQAVAHLVMTYQRQGFRAVLVKLPTIYGDVWGEDLAKASGATIIDPSVGLSLKDMNETHIGQLGHITITKGDTFVDGIKDMSEHIAYIKGLEDEDRVKRLNTKTARYFVGALSDAALSYRRLKVEDAINAAQQALLGGIVVGGGLALAKIKTGNKILDKALKAPHEQIVKNMGKTFSEKDMEEQEVFDPANVVLNAAKNAISVSAAILTANTVITYPRFLQPQNNEIPS